MSESADLAMVQANLSVTYNEQLPLLYFPQAESITRERERISRHTYIHPFYIRFYITSTQWLCLFFSLSLILSHCLSFSLSRVYSNLQTSMYKRIYGRAKSINLSLRPREEQKTDCMNYSGTNRPFASSFNSSLMLYRFSFTIDIFKITYWFQFF